jgi:hypothetical protein
VGAGFAPFSDTLMPMINMNTVQNDELYYVALEHNRYYYNTIRYGPASTPFSSTLFHCALFLSLSSLSHTHTTGQLAAFAALCCATSLVLTSLLPVALHSNGVDVS